MWGLEGFPGQYQRVLFFFCAFPEIFLGVLLLLLLLQWHGFYGK